MGPVPIYDTTAVGPAGIATTCVSCKNPSASRQHQQLQYQPKGTLHQIPEAFPCISTGVFGYPNEAAAEVVLHTLHKWLEDNKEKVDRIIICVFLESDEMIYKERLPRFFPVGGSRTSSPRAFSRGGRC
ncbi:UNVERIFIED_CONTAM: hypothetical protein K2H54_014092 [Gekko kuhli]